MSTKQKKTGAKSPLELLRNNSVPIMFILICAVCIPVSGFSPGYLINEILTRMGRNTFLILSLLIPIMAGMGLNFGMTLGAMAGQIGLIFAADWHPRHGTGRDHFHSDLRASGPFLRKDAQHGQGP